MAHPRKDATEEKDAYTDPDRLSILPSDLLRYSLFPLLASSAGAQLAQTSRRFKDLPESKKATIEFRENLKRLLSFVAQGNKREAEKLISQYPELLFYEGQTSDYSFYYHHGKYYQRKLQGTALQIALGAEDVNLYDATGKKLLGKGMVEMILRHLKKLSNGEAIIAEQIQKQFPAGWKEQEEKEHECRLIALHEVRNVINASSDNKECQAAIRKFKDALAPQKIISTGKHWDTKLLLAAFEMGYKEYSSDLRKTKLFYKEVIAYIQALAPANYAMAQAQGLKYLSAEGEKFKRNLKFRHGNGHYYPLFNSASWVDCYYGQQATAAWDPVAWGDKPSCIFENSAETKTTILEKLISQPSIRHCVVM